MHHALQNRETASRSRLCLQHRPQSNPRLANTHTHRLCTCASGRGVGTVWGASCRVSEVIECLHHRAFAHFAWQSTVLATRGMFCGMNQHVTKPIHCLWAVRCGALVSCGCISSSGCHQCFAARLAVDRLSQAFREACSNPPSHNCPAPPHP